MTVSVTEYGTVSVLKHHEGMIGDAVDAFRRQATKCTEARRYEIVVDCAEMDQIDSDGLEALIDLVNECEGELGSVRLCGLDPTMAKVLEITRLARRFEQFDDLESAVESFS